MPLELVAVGIRQPVVREYEERSPGPGEVLVRSVLSAEKHGNRLDALSRQSPFSGKTSTASTGCSCRRTRDGRSARTRRCTWGMRLWALWPRWGGRRRAGGWDRVHGNLPIRETHTVGAGGVKIAPEGVSDEMLVCIDRRSWR